jgi:hypothetical protein
MYLTAQYVVAPSGASGVNSFLYSHPGRQWDAPPSDIPGQNLGLLAHTNVTVPPPGNRVRSNLEIVAPDDIDRLVLKGRLLTFLKKAHGKPSPCEATDGPCRFRMVMDAEVAEASWKQEITALAQAATELLGR